MKKLLLAIITISSLLGAGFAVIGPTAMVSAQCTGNTVYDPQRGCVEQGGASQPPQRVSADCKTIPLNTENCPFLRDYVSPAIKALSGAVGVVVLIMIAWGGLQYTSSRDNPQQTAQAKDHISNAVLALIMYVFMVAFLNWLVPGGLF